jgi:hypothetical protein
MSDSFTETETVGCFTQLKDSIKGVAIGILMVLVSFPVLFINEWNAVTEAQGIKEVAANVVSVSSDKIDKGNDGKLIHTTGNAKVEEAAVDTKLLVTDEGAIKINRTTEIYQWVEETKTETEKKTGGKKEKKKTTTYKKEWVKAPIDSSKFKKQKKHTNSSSRWDDSLASKDFTAKKVSVGAFDLPAGLISKVSGGEALSVTKKQAKAVKDTIGKVKVKAGNFYLGDPDEASIGDIKISFKVVKAEKLSFVAQQEGDNLVEYKAGNDRSYMWLSKGVKNADQMVSDAESGLAVLTWFLRVFGWLLMFGGITMVFKPLVVIADVIPFIGSMLETGITVFAGLGSFGVSFITISIAWIFFRPLIGIPLCLCGLVSLGGLVALGVVMAKKKKAAA